VSPGVSIVICCHNSERRLPETLSHLITQQVDRNVKWEVVVVDNASTDSTSLIAESLWPGDAPAPLKVIHERNLGLSYARYRGIQETRYEIVSFIDDDNWVCPEWVQIVSEIMCRKPDVGACGGRNDAVCETDPPWWFGNYGQNYAVGFQAEITGDITFSRGYLWGAGLNIRKSAWRHLESIGFKSLLVDRQGGTLSSGGDSEICFALRLAGWRLWYDERLKLQHYIPSDRLNWEYLRRLYRGFGASTVGLDPYKDMMLKPGSSLRQRSRQTWLWQVAGALKSLLRQSRGIWLGGGLNEGSPQILKMEWTRGRLIELLKKRNSYNENICAVREWKKAV